MKAEKQNRKDNEIVVFWIISDSKCEECGKELPKGSFLRVEERKALCLDCADLDHLFFLASGNAALTRRAGKHSALKAVVVKFSRTRKRYERQGILVEEEALDKAEEECLADEDQRARKRERAAELREQLDKNYVDEFGGRILERYPSCPPKTAREIAEHACRKYSGRIGRTAQAKEFSEEAIDLAVTAAVRHRHTEYDRLLSKGWDRWEARLEVSSSIASVLDEWSRENADDF